MLANVYAAYYSWKQLNKPLEHYFRKRKHLKDHWKRIKAIWIQMRRENCSYRLRSQPRLPNFQSTVKWIYITQIVWSNFNFVVTSLCLVVTSLYFVVTSLCLVVQGGLAARVWNRVYMFAPVKKFGRVRLSTNFPSKQIWRRMQTWKDDEFLLGFKFSRVQTSRKGFHELL